MDFNLTDEQQLIADSVTRFVGDHYALEDRQQAAKSGVGYRSENWQTMAELGWLGLPFSEAEGGFGGTQVDTMILMEAFGRGLVLEPYLPCIVLGAGALRYGSNQALADAWLPQVFAGEKRLAFAFAEPQSRFELNDVATTAKAIDGGYAVTGQKSMVSNAEGADALIVSVRTSGERIDDDGIALALVPLDADGVRCDHFPTVDGLRASEVYFENVTITADALLSGPGDGLPVLQRTVNDGILALCAEALGCMEMLYKDTVAYTQEREQFDRPLSDFQVLQHRMVDMFMEYEQCKSMLYRATLETAEGADTAQRTIHGLKYLVGKLGTFIGENAVQLHGGMGMTEELRLGHYFKRLLVIDGQFGNADHHLARFAA
ncbi:MAG: acyl-CoA dehydrogenase family protein [Pseudomonadota bacterium]